MTKILIVKTSSMGDIIHTLPALTDAAQAIPDISFDWVVEEAFVEIPKWHARVSKVIPVAWRRFRKQPLQLIKSRELSKFISRLRQQQYDYVIDAQGLIKSGIITRLSRGLRCGLDRQSAWEPIATLAYQKKIPVKPDQHAIKRMRQLFSGALSYPLLDSTPDYGLQLRNNAANSEHPYLLFIHGTTWETKEWPENHWVELAKLAAQENYKVLVPWGNTREEQRAKRIAQASPNVTVLPRTSLTDLASVLLNATAAVSVDTGLGHLAAALSVPTISLYGPTDPKEVGALGLNQQHIAVNFSCSPCWNQRCGYSQPSQVVPACFASIPPKLVWEQLVKVLQG